MVFTTILMFTYVAFSQTTAEVQIVFSEDDAEEIRIPVEGVRGEVDLTSSDLELVFDHDPSWVGLRFREVLIPKGATITEAYVQFTVDALVEGTTDASNKTCVLGALEPVRLKSPQMHSGFQSAFYNKHGAMGARAVGG